MQPDAFQPDAFQEGGDLTPVATAFQPDAFQQDAFQMYAGDTYVPATALYRRASLNGLSAGGKFFADPLAGV